jgi:aspartate racemase
MSWESSIEYYRVINQAIREELGGMHSGKIVLVSVDFAEIEELQMKGDWDQAGVILAKRAQEVQAGGADFLLICTNTMHLLAEQVQAAIQIPLLHIADATAKAVKDQQISVVGLLGTRFTMEKDFYKGRLETLHQLDVIIPEKDQRDLVHQVIYDELVQGLIRDESKGDFREVINGLIDRGAEGIILGCTEIGLLVQNKDIPLPVFDTMEIHALAAVEAAIGRYNFD